jgi:hypothetical protein
LRKAILYNCRLKSNELQTVESIFPLLIELLQRDCVAPAQTALAVDADAQEAHRASEREADANPNANVDVEMNADGSPVEKPHVTQAIEQANKLHQSQIVSAMRCSLLRARE